MKRTYVLTFLLALILQICNTGSYAQTKKLLEGDWIKVSASYADGRPLENINPMRYIYLKYSFKGDKAAIISYYSVSGMYLPYQTNGKQLKITSAFGLQLDLKLTYLTADTLIIIQQSTLGANDRDNTILTFVKESVYKAQAPKAQDILVSAQGDTVYKAGPIVHPVFDEPDGYGRYLQKNMRSYKKYNVVNAPEDSDFFATFIVRKTGIIDSITIIKGLGDDFNQEFIEVCKKSAKKWSVALRNNVAVDAKMTYETTFNFLEDFVKINKLMANGRQKATEGDYDAAINYYDRILTRNPREEKALINRAECYLKLDNVKAACEDYERLKSFGFASGEDLAAKYCR